MGLVVQNHNPNTFPRQMEGKLESSRRPEIHSKTQTFSKLSVPLAFTVFLQPLLRHSLNLSCKDFIWIYHLKLGTHDQSLIFNSFAAVISVFNMGERYISLRVKGHLCLELRIELVMVMV